jgi:molybdate transport system substrate-binding protein
VLAEDALGRLAADGIVLANSQRVFARSATAVAVPSGRPLPPRCDEAAIRSLVANARAIGLSTGPSGVAVRTLLRSWGFDHKPPGWIVEAPPGVPVAHLLARGDVDLGFQQLSELLGERSITIIGPVPASLLPMTAFSIGLHRHTSHIDHALAFINALTSKDTAAVIRRHGMEPG